MNFLEVSVCYNLISHDFDSQANKSVAQLAGAAEYIDCISAER